MNTTISASSNHPHHSHEHHRVSRSLLKLRVPVWISGTDFAGQMFSEGTATELVSPSGATFHCSRSLAPDKELIVRAGNREILGRVVGQTGVSEDSHSYGIAFLREDQRFWGVSFPKHSLPVDSPILVCCRCGENMTAPINEIEALVLRANRQVHLPCSTCGTAGVWKVAEPIVVSDEVDLENTEPGDSAAWEAATKAQRDPELISIESLQEVDEFRPSTRTERRGHNRVNLSKAKACIERPGAERDVIDVVNVSRGGACVRSTISYSLGSWIRIACPYTIGGSNIFQSGRVVRVTVGESSREYGIEYVRLV